MTIVKSLELGVVLQCILAGFILLPLGKEEKCKEVLPNTHFSCVGTKLNYIPAEIPVTAENLDFSFNYLGNLHQAMFPQLPHLRVLDLTRCHIQLIAVNAFHNVRNVTTLILTGNQIKELGNQSLNLIQELVVVDNSLSSLEELHLWPSTKLQVLNAGTNNIESLMIPHYFVNLSDFKLLDLHANKIRVITVAHTLILQEMSGRNLTLILSRNPILHIEPGAFQGIYLHEFCLLGNHAVANLTKSHVMGLSGLKVDKLVVGQYRDATKILTSGEDTLDGLCSVNFQEIYFRHRETGPRPISVFRCMLNATKITIVQGFEHDMEFVQFRQLKELHLRNHKLRAIPARQLSHLHTLETLTITDNRLPVEFGESFVDLPHLKHVDLSFNEIKVRECCRRLFNNTPQLRYLNMRHNTEIYFDTMPFKGLELLEVLDLQHTQLSAVGQYPLLSNLNRLKYLDISYTGTVFMSQIPLVGLSNLEVLIISGNGFQGDSLRYVFANLTNLEHLDISNCEIKALSWHSFTRLKKLRHLVLNSNRLLAVDFLTNPSLGALAWIDAGQNNIVAIPQNVLSSLPTNLSIFDLSHNPMECSCSNEDFIKWTIHQREKLKNLNETLCKTTFSTYIRVIDVDITNCRYNWGYAIAILFMLSFVAAVAYRYKFYLRYGFILLRGYRNPKHMEFQYDAFVIYSSEDEAWVMDELVENIERGVPPFRLCLHMRDFEVGKSITSNIIDEGIVGSRKVIVVVSRHFFDSAWCCFEFELAQSWSVFEETPSLIIVILEDVEEERTRKVLGLHKYLKKNTYLKWKGNYLSNVKFWNRLRNAIIAGK
ncbi:toll-like receptor 4 [Megalops cyprinoides]|uniref:toll-like receptor 4 n=1 Tax=Megalops cyprinoides TaxID=118141 RepID=UPI001864B8DD|nr:toll-like receptor 4 [Megalops cyprinoides]